MLRFERSYKVGKAVKYLKVLQNSGWIGLSKSHIFSF